MSDIFAHIISGVFILLGISLILAFIRLVRGPSLANRVIALDLIATIVVGIMVLLCVKINDPLLLRQAIIVALISFLGTIAFAYYIEKRGSHD